MLFFSNLNIAVSQQVKHQRWVGLEYTQINEIPFFKQIIGNSAKLLPNQSYSVSDNVQGGRHYIFLERLLPTGPKRFRIIQTLDAGKLQTNEDMYISECSNNGKADEYIIAIVKLDTDKEVLKTIRKAWKIDIISEIFTLIDPHKVTCLNEGYGL